MNGLISIEIQTEIVHCLNNGMKNPNSIYQHILDTVPSALSNSETEMLVYDLVKILKDK